MEYLLSLIVPIYNGERFIKDLFSNIKEKNNDIFNLMELLFVDDGSTDGSYTLLCGLQKLSPNIVVLHQENGGIAKARNSGLLKANGKFVAFCDQDDSLVQGYSDCLRKMEGVVCDMMIANYYVSGVVQYKVAINELCERKQVITYARYMLAYGLVPYLDMPNNKLCDVSTVWNCIFCRDFLNKHHITFNSFVDYEDDWKFVAECLVRADKLCLETQAFYNWYVNPNSESHTHKHVDNYLTNRERLIDWIVEQLVITGASTDEIQKYRNSPEIARSVIVDTFYNACDLEYHDFWESMKELNNHGWIVSRKVVAMSKTKLQRFFLSLLWAGLYRTAYTLNKYFLKRTYH